MAQERRTVTVEQAAEILGISRGSAYTLAKSGALPTVRLGRRLLVPRAAMDRLLGETPSHGLGRTDAKQEDPARASAS
jgi:excisionase family DNA binding protein